MTSERLHVHYCHGLESGPQGYKASAMRDWARVTVPDQHMSVWDVRRRNSMIRSYVRRLPRWPSRGQAARDSLEACVQIQRHALDAPDVVVGSSWGGLVTSVMLVEGIWTGPTVLLCPALRVMERRLPVLRSGPRSADTLIARLAALPQAQRAQICLVHGTADRTVPFADSEEIAGRTGIRLEPIDGGSHGLSVIVPDGRLQRFVTAVARGGG